ncbi:MAG: glycosyltransferase family 9 protein [Nitrospirae bacterium]|nr:glycosyltransferase family 9 protein [Nitrospirota bacterium]
MTRTIVMIHPGSLGDVFLAVSAMIRLRARFPNYNLVLCAEDQAAKLLLACGIIDAWASVEGLVCAGLFVGADQSTGQVQRWLEHCDLAVAWMRDLDGKLSETLKAIGAREVIVRSPFSAAIQATHQRDRFLEAINEAPSDGEQGVLLAVTEPVYQLGRACLEEHGVMTGGPLVVIHPGSGSVHKCVSPETLAYVAGVVQTFGAISVVLEGPADREPVERLLHLCVNPPIVLRSRDILTVAGVLSQTRLFVGQDSGVTHLAGLMGVRTVALFGPTDPDRWAPQGTHITVVQGASCFCQSWADVSRCREKPCLEIPRDHVAAVCLAHLKETRVSRESTPDVLSPTIP